MDLPDTLTTTPQVSDPLVPRRRAPPTGVSPTAGGMTWGSHERADALNRRPQGTMPRRTTGFDRRAATGSRQTKFREAQPEEKHHGRHLHR